MSTDFLSMPDDELPEFAEVEREMAAERESAQEQEPVEQEQQQEQEVEQETTEEEVETTEEAEEEAEKPVETEENQEDPAVNPLSEPDDKVTKPTEKPVKTAEKPAETTEDPAKKPETAVEKETVEEPADKPVALTPEAFQEKILAPFKANGKEIQVKSVDEAVRLMQMGANYNLKMATLKPTLGMMRQLDDAGLLAPETIANVIDLLKHKNPAAIAKLAKDAGVDPLDVKEEDVKSYKPQAQPVDEAREKLDGVLDQIEHSPHYARVLKSVKGFDQQTKTLITQSPEVLTYLDSHMNSGVYDIIETEINRRKAIGEITGDTPFLLAYKQVGDALNEQGAFNHIGQATATEPVKKEPTAPVKRAVTASTPAKDPVVNQRRKAAAPTKAVPTAPKVEFNPLTMSDEEFEKHAALNRQYAR